MDYFQKFHFSIRCHSTDYAVIHCLRSLCEWAEKAPYPHRMIGWGHTKKTDWQRDNQRIKLRFTDKDCRQAFVDKEHELLSNRWTEDGQDDSDPATPTRNR